jgi:hypothetical protein
MTERATQGVAFSHMATLATIAAIALASTVVWQVWHAGSDVTATNPEPLASAQAETPFDAVDWQAALDGRDSDDPDGLSNIGDNVVNALVGTYNALAQEGVYTPEAGEAAANDIAGSLKATVSYRTYTEADIKTDADTSASRLLAYRNDMRIALEPLLKNNQYELSVFALYVETTDAAYAEALKKTAGNYRAAIANAEKTVVPHDAVDEHAEVLNALSEFAAIIARMGEHGDDAFAAVALLKTYDSAERRLFNSFDALARYGREKQS